MLTCFWYDSRSLYVRRLWHKDVHRHFANIFLCHHEQKWLKDCPQEFRPAYYRRYVDDCFLVFNDRSHIDIFLTYLNGQHSKMRFTKEVESNGCISFLDLNLRRQNNTLQMSIFRNATLDWIGLDWIGLESTK